MKTQPTLPRLGAASGILFTIVLFAASGHHAYPVGLIAIALFVPFAGYLHSLLRAAEGTNGWLSTTAFAAGLMGITIKIVSVVPEHAKEQTTKGTALYNALYDMAGIATVISLWPLALMVATVAVLALRTRALPRWLGSFAAVTAVALAVNGSFLHTQNVPALVLFLLWTLVTSIVLLLRTREREAAQVSGREVAARA